MSARALSAIIYDTLVDDICLGDYLDTPGTTTHGSEDWCDEPLNTHQRPPIRREDQGWPGDFSRAVVTFGRIGRSPWSDSKVGWVESWTFVIGIWVRQTVTSNEGERSPGDLWAMDIYDSVVRALGWDQRGLAQDCRNGLILVARRRHVGDIVPLTFNEDLGAWEIQTRFRWAAVSRGLIAPQPPACCPA